MNIPETSTFLFMNHKDSKIGLVRVWKHGWSAVLPATWSCHHLRHVLCVLLLFSEGPVGNPELHTSLSCLELLISFSQCSGAYIPTC